MRKVLAIALLLATLPGWSAAGTGASPEIADPAGDATVLGSDGGYADLVATWFTSVRDGAGDLSAIEVHFATARAPQHGENVFFAVDWSLDAGQDAQCPGTVYAWRSSEGEEESVRMESSASVTYWCGDDEEGEVEVAGLAVRIGAQSGPLTYGFAGSETIVTIPVSVFSTGHYGGRFVEGARLVDAFAQSQWIAEVIGLPADQTGCAQPQPGPSCEPRPYEIGS